MIRAYDARGLAIRNAALRVAAILVLSLCACSRSAPPAETKRPAASVASQRAESGASKAASTLAQTPLEKGMADRLKKNEEACAAGNPNGCAYPILAKAFQALRVACDNGDAGACHRLFNTMRNEDDRAEFVERCEAGYTRGCLILAEYYLVISPDAAKVAQYQAMADAPLNSAPK